MTRVCIVGKHDLELRYELISRETAREALSTYDLHEPYANSIALDTVSLGAAVSLLNDLNWYLVRYAADVLVREPSVSSEEWLSRDLATAIRDGDVDPTETGEYLKVYGVVADDPSSDADRPPDAGAGDADEEGDDRDDDRPAERPAGPGDWQSDEADGGDGAPRSSTAGPARLVEPMYAMRRDGDVPEYDLRAVEETVVVRVTEAEFGG